MKNLKYIAMLALSLFTLSCNQSYLDDVSYPNGVEGTVEITARIMPYITTNVDTRADYKTDAEKNINNTCLAVIRENKCVDVRYSSTSNATFVINKAELKNGDKFCILANLDGDPTETGNIEVGTTLDELLTIKTSVSQEVLFEPTSANMSTWVLPMIGFYEITDTENLPSIIPVPLESLYAKMNFTIWSKPEQEAEGHDKASFHLEGVELHNVPKTVDFVGGTVNSTTDDVEVYDEAFDGSYSLDPNKSTAQGNSKAATFVCYVPERFLKPTTPAEDFVYPFGKIADLDEDEKKRYPQRHKPCLVQDKQATFARLKGEYINHQGHNYIVTYDIYFGEDNYSNFDIERNKQYNHELTIKGILTSSDETIGAEGEGNKTIAIDHRVDVTRVAPIITNLRRETLLDSHFEVRPLRIRKNPDFTGSTDGATVKVEISYKDQGASQWVGIERSFGGQAPDANTYLVYDELPSDKKNAAGKRRYFTAGLPQNLQAAVTVPVTDAGETVWLYVDEADPANAGDDVRVATITVTYLINGTPYGDPIKYDLNQRELFKVSKGDNEYLIEYQEEYLHNYDAYDSYGTTDYEGMKWGLEGEQLSYTKPAILIGKGGVDSFSNNIKNTILNQAEGSGYYPYYDFYLPRDVKESIWTFTSDDAYPYNKLINNHSGHSFTKNIVDKVHIGALPLYKEPESAVEYCYNKNKRQSDGTIKDEDFVWYLPAIDEIEEIVKSQYNGNYSYIRFEDFRGKFYWSSQPVYEYNYIDVKRTTGSRYGIYMTDNVERARATKVTFTGGNPSDDNNYKVEESGLKNEFCDEDDTINGNNVVMTAQTMIFKYIYAEANTSGSVTKINQPAPTGYPNTFERTNASCDGGFFGIGTKDWVHTVIEPVYEDGAKMRTDMARVRCVRKM